jgi:cytochrome c peroxidase
MQLSDNDRVDLVAFLKTLTDIEFLFNPKFSDSAVLVQEK